MQNPLTLISTLSLISLVLVGCTSTKDNVLPQNGPSMKTIYDGHIQAMNARNPQVIRRELGNRPLNNGEAALQGYARDAFNEIDVLFPRLPNPTLVMYVFPHLAGDTRSPVPGYATAFSMYEQVEYALPGEVLGLPGGKVW